MKGKKYDIKPQRKRGRLIDVKVVPKSEAGYDSIGGIPEELEYEMELYRQLFEEGEDSLRRRKKGIHTRTIRMKMKTTMTTKIMKTTQRTTSGTEAAYTEIWEILHKPETVVFFDIDGTLTSYCYGRHHAHHELDGTPEFRDVNIYADCKSLKPLYDYISGHDVNRLFCISREPHMRSGSRRWSKDFTAFPHPIVFIRLRRRKSRRSS